jgi:hypothetical protein
MKKFLTRLIDSGNRQVEAHLVLLCLGTVTFIALSVYHVVALRLAFDPGTYGQGFGALLAGGGAAAWGQGLQRKTENDHTGGNDNEPDR